MRVLSRRTTPPVGRLDLTGLPTPTPAAPESIGDRDVLGQAADVLAAGERTRWELQLELNGATAAVSDAQADLDDAALQRDNSADVDAVMAATEAANRLEVIVRTARRNETVLHSRMVALDNHQQELQRAVAAVQMADATRSVINTAALLSQALTGPLSTADGAAEASRRHGGRLTVPGPVEELRHALDADRLAERRADAELDCEGERRQLAALLDVATMETHGLAVSDG
jgi:hypothetical protein